MAAIYQIPGIVQSSSISNTDGTTDNALIFGNSLASGITITGSKSISSETTVSGFNSNIANNEVITIQVRIYRLLFITDQRKPVVLSHLHY